MDAGQLTSVRGPSCTPCSPARRAPPGSPRSPRRSCWTYRGRGWRASFPARPGGQAGHRPSGDEEVAMTYGVVIDGAAPVEMYDALHAELMRRTTGPLEGFLCHIGRTTPTG